jgi:hypothetical protein
MTDIATFFEGPLLSTVNALFTDVTEHKMYVTGGLGADGRTEAFGAEYALPNRAYAETCAAVGGMLWYHRYFLRTGNVAAYDALERTLYNGYLSGVSLSGDKFFYQNPLVSDGRVERSSYFDVACCPANLSRLMAELPGLIYAQQREHVYVNLFIGSQADLTVGGVPVKISQQTNYPWDGKVTIHVDPARSVRMHLSVRIPAWTGNPTASDLYRFSDNTRTLPVVTLNGGPVAYHPAAGEPATEVGQVREWRKGDTLVIDLPMPVRRVLANDRVTEDAGKAVIQRGPIVYALEGIDNGGSLKDVKVPLDATLTSTFRPDVLGGVQVVTGKAGERAITAIPYYAWNNRGKGEMEVWTPY